MTLEEINQAKVLYDTGMSLSEVANRLGYNSLNTIGNAFRKMGISIRSRAGSRNTVNHNAFDIIDSEAKAYFVGLLLADGCIVERPNSQRQIALELQQSDINIVEQLKTLVGSDNKIGSSRGAVKLGIHSNKIANALAMYGIVPRKTGNKQFYIDRLPKQYHRDFIRGFFDGNGWVTYARHGKYSSWNVGFADGSVLLHGISDYLINQGIVRINTKIIEHRGCHMLTYASKQDVNSLLHYMYDGSTVFLGRKHNKAIECMDNTERGLSKFPCRA